MNTTGASFSCFANTTFVPHWTDYSFDLPARHTSSVTLFVVPRLQSAVETRLSSMDGAARVFVLNDESTISAIVDVISQLVSVHVIFVTESKWHPGTDETAYRLFLSLIQNIAVCPSQVLFDVVTVRALPNPWIKSVLHPADGVYVGLAETMAKEFSHWQVRQFNLDCLDEKNLQRIRFMDFSSIRKGVPSPLHIVGDRLIVSHPQPLNLSCPLRGGFKTRGVYLILGGNGGIGSVLADYLVKHYDARVILAGRRDPAPAQRKHYEGHSVVFEKVDICEATEVEALIARHPHIDGIIHSALVLDDASLMTMTPTQLGKVLAPKLTGTLHLIQAIRHRSLDFVLFFSSIQSFIANAGQGNYTAACVCKDALSALLNDALLINSKVINWGYWGQVGIVATDFYRQRMQQLEIGSIEPLEGMQIIEQFLQSPHQQLAVVKGSESALRRLGFLTQEQPVSSSRLQPYLSDSDHAKRSRESLAALENYTRWKLHQLSLPSEAIPRHRLLREAIRAIPSAKSKDRTSLLASHPEILPHVRLLDTCMDQLPRILSGEREALSVLFPEGRFDLVEPVYCDNPVADYFNHVVVDTVLGFVHAKKDEKRPLRILEIGAGTGGTSRKVIPALSGLNIEYVFTDLSPAFLNKAKKLFTDYDFVRYGIYNVEVPYPKKNCFDVVIATNVIHATRNIHDSVHHVHDLLSAGGIFILNEITQRQDFATLTFGLTEGWWLSSDVLRIPNSPLLSIETWQKVLLDCHFSEVEVHGEEGQHIIVGHAGEKEAPVMVSPSQPSHAETSQVMPVKGETPSPSAVKEWLKELIATVMHMPKEEIEGDIPFSDYGIDSLISLELIQPMRNRLGYVPATVLFEYPTLNALASHFNEIHAGLFKEEATIVEEASRIVPMPASVPPEAPFAIKDGIAIVGMAGRFPAASDCEALWTLLKEGRDAFTDIPDERWSATHPNQSYTRRGAFIDDVDAFDHVFFNLTPIEAENMDPQERLFLQTACHAIHDAGLSLEKIAGREVGCFVGVMNHDYSRLTPVQAGQQRPNSLFWSIANRVSYLFNLRGPSFAIDSACSSSLYALHTAVMALLNEDCETALVGGVNLIVHPGHYDDLCNLHMLSPSGVCRPFGASADGFVDGEGVICLVLKRLPDAIASGDRIHGIIRGSAVNAGGKSNGYTAPNPEAQAALIQKALQRAKLTPADIDYMEAHGTGTELGDPIEIRGITKAMEGARAGSIALGSLKGNLGHLESAAGLAGVVKVLLQMQHEALVPTIHCERENSHLQLEKTPVHLNRTLVPWPASRPRRASVSSFGAGGANAHVILEAPARGMSSPKETAYYLFPLSAHSHQSLQKQLDELCHFLQSGSAGIAGISYRLCCVRSQLKYRIGFYASHRDSLLSQLKISLQQLLLMPRTRDPAAKSEDLMERFLSGNRQDADIARQLIQCFVQGERIAFERLFTEPLPGALPCYPFDPYRHWIAARETRLHREDTLLSQHVIRGHAMAPAAYTLSKVVESCDATVLTSVVWKSIITNLDEVEWSVNNGIFQLKHPASGRVYCEGQMSEKSVSDMPFRNLTFPVTENRRSGHAIYQDFQARGYQYGPAYRAIQWAHVDSQSVFSLIEVTHDWGYRLSPVVIDAALQTAILPDSGIAGDDIKVPCFVERIVFHRIPGREPIYCRCYPRGMTFQSGLGYDIELSDVNGRPLISLLGVQSIRTTMEKLTHPTEVSHPAPQRTSTFQLHILAD